MARKKRTAKGGSRGSPKGNTQQKIFWVLSLLVAISMVAYFGPVSPRRRTTSTTPTSTPTPIITVTPQVTPQLTPTPGS